MKKHHSDPSNTIISVLSGSKLHSLSPFPKLYLTLFILYHKYNDSVLFRISMETESSQGNRTKDTNNTITGHDKTEGKLNKYKHLLV